MKTTLIGIAIIVTIIAGIIPVALGKASFQDAAMYVGAIFGALTGLGFIFSKDKKGDGGPLAILAIIAISALGCRPIKEVTESDKSDSISVVEKITLRDTTVYIAADSAAIKALVKCPDLVLQENHSGKAIVRVQIKDNVLTANCLCAETEVKLQLATTTINQYRSAYSRYVNRKTVAAGGQRFIFFMAGMGAMAMLLILFFLIKYIMNFKSFTI
jgi:hypothetical protein